LIVLGNGSRSSLTEHFGYAAVVLDVIAFVWGIVLAWLSRRVGS
jgi:hypothetical protein